MLTDESEKIL